VNTKPVYKTWIRTNKLIIFLLISTILLIVALLPVNTYLRICAGLLALPFLYISVVLSYSYYQFASFGKNLQSQIHELIIKRLDWNGNGRLLDIGCGSGSLIIKAAKTFQKASLVGIDFWGDNWEYSKKQCETNSQIEGVGDRIEFIKASASKLPLKDCEFDAIVSCLTFHEVKDENNKTKVIKEALRVLKQGGRFVFLDLFMDETIFGDYVELQNGLKELDISKFEVKRLAFMIKLPSLLKLRKVLGNAAVIVGTK
jgi:ubiquinone/menaquinone biosynthesis C-methylase UbiE